MNISELKRSLEKLEVVNFKLPDGSYVPSHFHVTEVGLIIRHFIDCGGRERKENVVNIQLWEAGDYDHKLVPQKFLHILNLSKKVLGNEDLPVEVEYQLNTIGKFSLDFDGKDFVLKAKYTTCLAQDTCGAGVQDKKSGQTASSCCSPTQGCC